MATEIGTVLGQIGTGDYRLVKGKDVDITQMDSMDDPIAAIDLFMIDDGASGTQASTKKVTATALSTYFTGSPTYGDNVNITFGSGTDFTLDFNSDGDALFITNLAGNIWKFTSNGALILPTLEITPDAVLGGVYFDGTSFYLGVP